MWFKLDTGYLTCMLLQVAALTTTAVGEICRSTTDCSTTTCSPGSKALCTYDVGEDTGHQNGTCKCHIKEVELSPAVCSDPSMFRCSDLPLFCIKSDLKCNGVSECPDGEDESVEICGCLPNEFACNSTTCIDAIKRCDRQSDCENGEDEMNCETYICPDTHSKCANFFCILNEARCDFVDDCGDYSDEEICERRECFDTEFRCHDEECITIGYLCDGQPHCKDGSDEVNCEDHFLCDEGYYIQTDKLCDGWIDCPHSEADEIKCGNCSGDNFRCDNGRCIRNSNVCDGECDCFLTCEDEKDCDTSTCNGKDKYICRDNKRCIDWRYLCDDVNDCKNTLSGDDEYYCFYNSSRCEDARHIYGGVIQCSDGKCLPNGDTDSLACDHHVDCLDGADEDNCETKPCNSSQFTCDNGQCIPYRLRCNGHPNCFDRSDELNCDALECKYGRVRCKSGPCIPREKWCDYFRDCPDYSDETDCPSNYTRKCLPHEFQCNNGQCIDRKYECNGAKDVDRNGCADKSHLLRCRNFTCNLDYQFKCHQSFCINKTEVCDGRPDCSMGYTLDDELNCSFSCPDPEHVCVCRNEDMNCEHRNLTHLPYGVHNESMTTYRLAGNNITVTEKTFTDLSRLSYLDLTKNNILSLPVGAFRSLWRLTKLILEDNRIETIQNGTFIGLTNLREIYLHGNKIRSISAEGFMGLSQLHMLNLDHHRLTQLDKNAFQGLRNIRLLNLSNNHISIVEEGAFNGLRSIRSLDLSHNDIYLIKRNVFNGLKTLRFLLAHKNMTMKTTSFDPDEIQATHLDPDMFAIAAMYHSATLRLIWMVKIQTYLQMAFRDISNNVIDILESQSFDGLHNLQELITDEFRFCCAAKIAGTCLPRPDEFSSCTDLMSNFVLRVSIWVLGLVAFWGNLVVVIWRVRDVRNGKVHSFLITNLAIGDLFMGIYLMIIAVVDSYYRGRYILYDKNWRGSDLCKFAGFISTFSSELSVFTLTVITLDRLICIIFPLHLRRPKLRDAAFVMMWIWLIVLLISAFPLVGLEYFENFYGRSGVCLAFHITNTKPRGWEYSVAVFLVLNFVSFLIIFFSYLRMFFVAKKTRSAVRNPQDKNDSAMAKRMTIIVMTDFFCWVPIILLGFASLGGASIPLEIYAWVAVFILPLNSAINPVLYTICTAPFLRNFRKRASYFRKSFTGSSKNDTKHSFFEERSTHILDRKPIYRHLELMRMRSFNNKSFTTSHSHSSHSDHLI